MAIDGTMFFGNGSEVFPFRAFQFGTLNNMIIIQDYYYDYSIRCYRFQTWLAKPNPGSIAILKKIKSSYRDFQREETVFHRESRNKGCQYVQLTMPELTYQEVFEMLPRNSSRAETSFMALQNIPHGNGQTFFRPGKGGSLLSCVKSMFKQQYRSLDGYSYVAVMRGLHLIRNLRGYQPLNWTTQRFQKNPLYSKRMINRMATHVK